MEKIIKITANYNIYSFNALVPEKKAEKILKGILKSFQYLKQKYARTVEVSPLKVETSVVNPTLL